MRALLCLSCFPILGLAACRQQSPAAFVEGYYDHPPRRMPLAGANYHFDGAKVNQHWFTDVGPDYEGVTVGDYKVDGSRVILTFPPESYLRHSDGKMVSFPQYSTTLYWTKLGRAQLLLDQESWSRFNEFHILAGSYWILTGDNPPERNSESQEHRLRSWDNLLREDRLVRSYIPKGDGGSWKPPPQNPSVR